MSRLITVPIFPLRGVVLFPRLTLSLHVFEPRYRALLADVLDGTGMIGVPLLKPGHKEVEEEAPPIEEVFGIGRVLDYKTHEDGTSDVTLVGESRVRRVEELPLDVYRRAVVEVLPEEDLEGPEADGLREELGTALDLHLRSGVPETVRRQLDELVRDGEKSLRVVVHLIANLILPTTEARQALLAVDAPDELARTLLTAMAALGEQEDEDDGEDLDP